MKTIIKYINERGDFRKSDDELIAKYLGDYADHVKVAQTMVKQRMRELYTTNYYRYTAKSKADVTKFSGLLYDLLKHMDDILPNKIKGRRNYLLISPGTTKEDFVKKKEERYDDWINYLKEELTTDSGKMKEFHLAQLKSGELQIYFRLH